MMKKTLKFIILFLLGGFGYGICELVWRGFTHPSMFILGGICFLLLFYIEKIFGSLSVYLRCISGGIIITSLELITGCIVNVILKLEVWDYSQKLFNLYGQICLQFSVMWVLLCIPAFWLCSKISYKFNI